MSETHAVNSKTQKLKRQDFGSLRLFFPSLQRYYDLEDEIQKSNERSIRSDCIDFAAKMTAEFPHKQLKRTMCLADIVVPGTYSHKFQPTLRDLVDMAYFEKESKNGENSSKLDESLVFGSMMQMKKSEGLTSDFGFYRMN